MVDSPESKSLLPKGHEVQRRQLLVGQMNVEMFVVADPNRLAMELADDDFATDERLPYWAELWPSAIALSHFLATRGSLEGCQAIELGCGMGLTGVVAAMLGAEVLFTDFEADALRFAAANHALNVGSVGATRLLDWREPPTGLQMPLVLGADVIYERRFLEPFVSTLQTLVAPGGRALIAEPDRAVAAGVVEALEDVGFARELHMDEVQVGEATYPIWIHQLTAPAG